MKISFKKKEIKKKKIDVSVAGKACWEMFNMTAMFLKCAGTVYSTRAYETFISSADFLFSSSSLFPHLNRKICWSQSTKEKLRVK